MNSDVAPPPVAEYDFHPKIPILLGRRQGNEEYEQQCDSRKAAGHVGASKYGRVLTRYPVVVKLENCVDGGGAPGVRTKLSAERARLTGSTNYFPKITVLEKCELAAI
jgi:hypothetical protein